MIELYDWRIALKFDKKQLLRKIKLLPILNHPHFTRNCNVLDNPKFKIIGRGKSSVVALYDSKVFKRIDLTMDHEIDPTSISFEYWVLLKASKAGLTPFPIHLHKCKGDVMMIEMQNIPNTMTFTRWRLLNYSNTNLIYRGLLRLLEKVYRLNAAGIIHGDIHLDNVLVETNGTKDSFKDIFIIDFGRSLPYTTYDTTQHPRDHALTDFWSLYGEFGKDYDVIFEQVWDTHIQPLIQRTFKESKMK